MDAVKKKHYDAQTGVSIWLAADDDISIESLKTKSLHWLYNQYINFVVDMQLDESQNCTIDTADLTEFANYVIEECGFRHLYANETLNFYFE